MCTIRSDMELEAATVLNHAMLMGAILKIMTHEKSACPHTYREVAQSAHAFFAKAIVGTLDVSIEERKELFRRRCIAF